MVARGGAAHRRALLRGTLGTGRGRALAGTTALDDRLGVDTGLVNDARLYRALDQLGARKDALRAHPITRYREWFGVRCEFQLYDVTSTYWEGQAEPNPQARRGYSRDNRSDCPQVCIGLVGTPEGRRCRARRLGATAPLWRRSRRSSRPWKTPTA